MTTPTESAPTLPQVPTHIINAITQYGDARADDGLASGPALGNVITAIREHYGPAINAALATTPALPVPGGTILTDEPDEEGWAPTFAYEKKPHQWWLYGAGNSFWKTQEFAEDWAREQGYTIVQPPAQPAPAPAAPAMVDHNAVPSIRITLRQAERLVEFFGGHDAGMTVTERPENWEQVEEGLYAYVTKYPEDGSQFLGATEVDEDLQRFGRRAVAQPTAQGEVKECQFEDCMCRRDHGCASESCKFYLRATPAEQSTDKPAEKK